MALLHGEYLKSSGTDWNTKTLSAGSTYYSDPIRPHFSMGEAALRVTVTAGTVTITYQVSDRDDGTWYEPYSTDGDKVNTIATDLADSRWIAFEPVPCEYMRFVFVQADADSSVVAKYYQKEKSR